MKLISCYIENYGVISHREYDFSDGLNVFAEPNGEGKSTLASFIKAAFYGLPAYRSNTKEFEDRQHFYPFGGGKFGGSLTFSWKGVEYRLERFFDEKSGKGDTLTVYRGGKETSELGEIPGKTVFGIDGDAFSRSAFMSDEERAGAAGDIVAKLNKYVYDEDAEHTENALRRLDEKLRELKAKRGGGGLIDRLKEKKRQTEEEIRSLEALEGTLDGQYADRKRLVAEIARLEEMQKRYNEERVIRANRATYERYLTDISECGMQLKAYARKYPAGIPGGEETEECRRAESEIARNAAVAESAAADIKKRERLGVLQAKFANYPPETELEKAKNAAESYRQNEAKLKYQAPAPQKKERAKGGVYAAVAAAGGALAVAGIILCFIILAAGIALLTLGAVALAACGFIYLKKKTEKASDDGLSEVRARIFEDERVLRSFLTPYGYFSENPASDLESLQAELRELEGLKAETEESSAFKEKLIGRNAELSQKIRAVFAKYSLEYSEGALKTLEADGREIGFLKSRLGDLKARAEEFKSKNGIEELPPQPAENAEEELFLKRRELGAADKRISDDEERVSYLADKRRALAEVNEEIVSCERKHRIYTAVYGFLDGARGRLKDKYVSPVKEKFLEYSDKIAAISDYKIVMNEDFEVGFESHGQIRGYRHFSSGQRAVCSLCLRLALIDNLYPDEKPFFVLDDPFVTLDEKNMAGVARAVKALSENIQILYFCCHDSRKISEA